MKPISFVITILVCLLAVNLSLAQDISTGKADKQKEKISKMNIFKVNITSPFLKNYSFQYERILKKKISVALGIRFMPTGALPLKKTFLELANGDADVEKTINDTRLGNFAITPELRWYVGKKGYGKGFYIAPYYRFATFKADALPFEYDGGTGIKTVSLAGDVTTHSGGIMFGSQWFLGKSITLDWWILGTHYGTSDGTFTGTPSTPFTPNEQTDIKQQIEAIDLPAGKISAVVTANSAKAIIDGPWAGLRGGITFGIRF